ncbi:MAG TPA: dockerin type I domain-containing protein, partial [Chitinophagaceae bacterium]|nr:dockerin type I domain-containing protein [Chitinophagaceae bacterium]
FFDAAGNGTVVQNPGLLAKAFSQMADDTVAGGTVVDNIYCEKDPYTNGDDRQDWTGSSGSSAGNGTATTPSSFWDPPNIPDGLFPAGAVKVLVEFEVCAYCINGVDNGTCYGCIHWKYERTKGPGNIGTVAFVPGTPAGEPSAPSPSHTAAVTKFKTNHTDSTGAAFCPEARIDSILKSIAKLFENMGSSFYFKSMHSYRVLYSDHQSKKGPAIPGMNLPMMPIGDSILPGEYVFVPKGAKLGLTRTAITPATDSQIPFLASFVDLCYGSMETIENGPLTGIMHQGVRVKNCSGLTLCAAAPVNSTNPNAYVFFTTTIDNQLQRVVIKNSALSTQGVNCKNVMSTASATILNPGDSLVYMFSGMLMPCASTLNLKMYIAGYYNGGGLMAPVLMNQLENSSTGQCDTVWVDLHSAAPPFQTEHSSAAVLNQNGTLSCNFPALSGPYFIAVRHRNALETWSANPVNFNMGVANYDFTSSASMAFGANQTMVSPGVFALYSGDVNQDQNIDLLDWPMVDNDVSNFEFGYFTTDLNGDGNVDLLDLSVLEPGINNFIFTVKPN